jgi:hypothetical protein
MTLSVPLSLSLSTLSSFSTLSPREKVLGEETENTPLTQAIFGSSRPNCFYALSGEHFGPFV